MGGVDRAALPFVGALAAAGVVAFAWRPWACAPFLAALAFTLWFFRDPERRPPSEPGVIVSPADGKVIRAAGGSVSVFMNVFDVHVCRAPFPGRVVSIRHHPGQFLAAFRDDAPSRNERTVLEIRDDGVTGRFTLVAGLVARRIVCRVEEGAQLELGQRVGLIRFGSRVDVELPAGATIDVRVGDRVRAGTSVIARRSTGGSDPSS